MELSKSIYQLPLLVLPHLRPLGTSVGGKLLGTGASCIVTAVLRPCGGCICATTSLRVCDLAQVYTPASPHPCYLSRPQLRKLQLCGSRSMYWYRYKLLQSSLTNCKSFESNSKSFTLLLRKLWCIQNSSVTSL